MSVSELVRLPVVVALLCQLSSQAFKVVFYSLRERRFAAERFVHAGGIPSAHSAFVSALTAAVALRHGVTSEIFAVSFVFSAIIVYDAFRLRGHVQRHAEVLNRLIAKGAAGGGRGRPQGPADGAAATAAEKPRRGDSSGAPITADRLSENVGHTLAEVAIGVAWGVSVALVLS